MHSMQIACLKLISYKYSKYITSVKTATTCACTYVVICIAVHKLAIDLVELLHIFSLIGYSKSKKIQDFNHICIGT